MARPSTMPPPWVALADAFGGVGNLAHELGITGMHLHRLSSGKTAVVRKPIHDAVERAAAAKGLPNPFTVNLVPTISEDVLAILDLFGGSPSMEQASPESITRLKELVTVDQLIALTEDDSVPVNVLRAAGFLLEVA